MDFYFITIQMRSDNFKALVHALESKAVEVKCDQDTISFKAGSKKLHYFISSEGFDFDKHSQHALLPLDYIVSEPVKTSAAILSRLGLNERIFARNCEVKKAEKEKAETFLNKHHLMNATQSAYNYGLFYKNELVAIASFSKGRKMNRLPSDKRSYELIRFCCRYGTTITGGLTKLLKHFSEEKGAGDIMTYVDKQWSDGSAFVKAGFKKQGETEANYFLIERKIFKRIYFRTGEVFDSKKFYLTQNKGNIKLIYTPGKI